MKTYAIHYAYPTSDKAKELGQYEKGIAYICEVEREGENFCFNLAGKIVKTDTDIRTLINYAKDKNLPLHEYSLGTARFPAF